MPLPALLAAAAMAMPMTDLSFQSIPSRFVRRQPLAGVPGVLFDTRGYGANFANRLAAEKGLQGRVMWIDATANVDRYNEEGKIVALVQSLAQADFNTIALDVKPISGHVIYPSAIAPKLTEWRGKTLPLEFDPVAVFVRECKRTGLSLLLSLNAFSEGHTLMNTGPAYEHTDWQTVLYEPKGVLRLGAGSFPLFPEANGKALNKDAVYWVNRADLVPTPAPDLTVVTVDWPRGSVVAVATEGVAPKIPSRGFALVGYGAASEFLRAHAAVDLEVGMDTEAEFVRIGALTDQQVPLMVNPNHPEVRARALAVIEEVARKYDADGFLYDDRFRYAGINADFSPRSQGMFEAAVGKPLKWPDDVFKFTITPTFAHGVAPGPYYDAWMAWRAMRMQEYLAEVRATVKKARPNAIVGLYVGSWYGEYPQYGVNVASPSLAEGGFWFLTPEYQLTGVAPLIDLLITGAYYPTPTMWDGMASGAGIGNTIEGAGQLSVRIARDQCWTYAGLMLSQFKGDPARLGAALQAACGSTQGVMVFDLSHDSEASMPVFASAFASRVRAAHSNGKSLEAVRKARADFDKKGGKEEPVTIGLGSAGTGH